MTDTSNGNQNVAMGSGLFRKPAAKQKEGRTFKAYKKQYAPLKWKCSLCRNKVSFSSKAQLERHNRSDHNRELPEMGA